MSDWQPTATRDHIRSRARILTAIREFFRNRNITEVTTPVLTRSGVTDPQLDSLALEGRNAFLRTSPEYWHKRLLAAGFGDLYEIGPVFRAGERGRLNQVEFTMLEWYRVGWSWRQLAEEVIELIRACLGPGSDDADTHYIRWRDCFRDRLDLDPLNADNEEIAAAAADAPADCSRDMLLDYLFATRIQPEMAPGSITVVSDYPASQAALARLKPGDERVAERFEVFHGSVELANGYRELTDPECQHERFKADNCLRAALERPLMPIDSQLLAALEHGLPDCSGVALGVDRLVMLALGCDDIQQVMAFPAPDPE